MEKYCLTPETGNWITGLSPESFPSPFACSVVDIRRIRGETFLGCLGLVPPEQSAERAEKQIKEYSKAVKGLFTMRKQLLYLQEFHTAVSG